MIKTHFVIAIKEFRYETEGAACFFDPVRNTHFCANRLTRAQAEEFAAKHDLVLQNWQPGISCSEASCGQ